MSGAFLFEGLEDLERDLRAFADALERDTNTWIKDLAYTVTYNLVMETPQYSGAAASAWRVGIGAPAYITEKPEFAGPGAGSGAVGDNPYSKRNRNMQAVNEALFDAKLELMTYTILRGDIHIMNGLDYAHWFEQGLHDEGSPLRAQNLPHRAVAQVVADSTVPIPSLWA